MRLILPLLALLLSLSLKGQERNFRELFVSPWQECNQQEKESVAQLAAYRAGRVDSAQLDRSLSQWGLACGSTDPLLSIQLLRQMEAFGRFPANFTLEAYLVRYYRFLKNLEEEPVLLSHLYRYRELKKNWSQELLQERNWSQEERLLLHALGENKPADLMAVFRRKDFYRDSLARAIRTALEAEAPPWELRFDLAYQQQWYEQNLGDFFRPSPGLSLNLAVGTTQHQVVSHINFAFLQNPRDLRLYQEDSTYFTRSRLHLTFGLAYSAQLWQNRWSELRGGLLLAYNILNTDAEHFNADGEVYPLTINAGSAAPFLEYAVYTQGRQQLGLRFHYHFVDFNGQGELRSNLRGNFSSLGLFYRW